MRYPTKKALLRVTLMTAVLAVPTVVQASSAGAQSLPIVHAAANASTYPGPTLNPTTVTAGGSTTVSGVQCDPSFGPTNIFVSLVASSGNVLSSASVPPNADGSWQTTVTVPPDSAAGSYAIYSTCDMYYTQFYYPEVALTVSAASPSPWTVQNTVNQKGPTGSVTGISCVAAASCTAVGTFVNSGGQTVPMAQRWNGTKWVVSALPVLTGQKAYGLNGVSCRTTTSCLAVGNYVSAAGRQLTFSEVWNGVVWVVQEPVNPTGGSADVLSAVSCAAPGNCTAVGSYTTYVNGQLQSVGLAETWNGVNWSQQTVPVPGGHGAFRLTSVSCPAISSCTATGSHSTNPYSFYGSSPLALQWNGSAWAPTTLAIPVDANSYGENVTSVSCSAVSACTAVGSYYSTTLGPTPLVERWTGTSWGIQTTAQPLGGYYPTMTSISCSGASSCEAVGWYYSNASEVALAESWDGSTWTQQTVPSPMTALTASLTAVSCPSAGACSAIGTFSTTPYYTNGLQQNWSANLAAGAWTAKAIPTMVGTGFDQLQAVSCSSATACNAVGSYESASGQSLALAEGWNGTRWTVQTVPLPIGATSDYLSGIACASATACIAVGTSRSAAYVQSALIEVWNGTSWSIDPVPIPAASNSSVLGSVSCSTASACTAIGSFTSSVTGQPAFLAENWNGSTWTATSLAAPADFSYGQLLSVSCSATTACVAVGYYINTSYVGKALVYSWNGATWSSLVLANISQPGAALSSVSCTSSTSCVAVGSYYGYFYGGGGSAPLVEVWNGTTWTAQSAAGGGNRAVLSGISCTSSTACTASGSVSVYGYPNLVPLMETWNGSTWTEQPMPKLPNAAGGALNSVSCVSTSVCAAVGSRYLASGTTLAEGEGGA